MGGGVIIPRTAYNQDHVMAPETIPVSDLSRPEKSRLAKGGGY